MHDPHLQVELFLFVPPKHVIVPKIVRWCYTLMYPAFHPFTYTHHSVWHAALIKPRRRSRSWMYFCEWPRGGAVPGELPILDGPDVCVGLSPGNSLYYVQLFPVLCIKYLVSFVWSQTTSGIIVSGFEKRAHFAENAKIWPFQAIIT